MGRILLAGFLGGIAMFFMMSVFHMSPIAQIDIEGLGGVVGHGKMVPGQVCHHPNLPVM